MESSIEKPKELTKEKCLEIIINATFNGSEATTEQMLEVQEAWEFLTKPVVSELKKIVVPYYDGMVKKDSNIEKVKDSFIHRMFATITNTVLVEIEKEMGIYDDLG